MPLYTALKKFTHQTHLTYLYFEIHTVVVLSAFQSFDSYKSPPRHLSCVLANAEIFVTLSIFLLHHFQKSPQHTPALYEVGMAYQEGIGVDRNMEKSIAYLQKATDANYPQAMFQVALLYYHGEYVRQDFAKAVALFEKSSKSNQAEATYYLAVWLMVRKLRCR